MNWNTTFLNLYLIQSKSFGQPMVKSRQTKASRSIPMATLSKRNGALQETIRHMPHNNTQHLQQACLTGPWIPKAFGCGACRSMNTLVHLSFQVLVSECFLLIENISHRPNGTPFAKKTCMGRRLDLSRRDRTFHFAGIVRLPGFGAGTAGDLVYSQQNGKARRECEQMSEIQLYMPRVLTCEQLVNRLSAWYPRLGVSKDQRRHPFPDFSRWSPEPMSGTIPSTLALERQQRLAHTIRRENKMNIDHIYTQTTEHWNGKAMEHSAFIYIKVIVWSMRDLGQCRQTNRLLNLFKSWVGKSGPDFQKNNYN